VVMDNSVLGDPDAVASEILAAGTGEDDGVAAELLRILEEKEERRGTLPGDIVVDNAAKSTSPEGQEQKEHRSPSSQRRKRGDHHHRGRHHKRHVPASQMTPAAPDPTAPSVVSAEQLLLRRPFASPLVMDPRRPPPRLSRGAGEDDATSTPNIRQHAVPRSLLTIPATTLPLSELLPTTAWAESPR
jgi:hypothetical protein